MGEFDRKQTAEGNAGSGKVILAILLAVAFIGVLGYHFMHQGPKPASASSISGSESLATETVVDESPDEAQKALRNDPTANLLRETSASDSNFDQIPRNPFRMSDKWKASLIRSVTADPKPSASFAADPRPATPLSLRLADYKLAGISHQKDDLCAIINGQIVTIGQVVDGARVLAINEDSVTLQNAAYPEGPTSVLTLQPKLNK